MPINVLEFLDRPGRRLPVHAVLDGSHVEVDGVRTIGEIQLDGEAFAQLSTLYLDVDISANIVQPCRRCLASIEIPFKLRESFTFPIPPQAETIDVRPHVIELVLSSHDPNVLCRPDCRGLCPICGEDLNWHPDHRHAAGDDGRRKLGEFFESWSTK
ncbi:MAG: DUF177 domain-containing protein [Candidatus Bipolaricaulota bacterium]|nr:DUF177 domain-containing protein [Candidatus Bipolaricaulota bacterium]